jgi:RNA polymerase sigma factor (TIGR02999 family)
VSQQRGKAAPRSRAIGILCALCASVASPKSLSFSVFSVPPWHIGSVCSVVMHCEIIATSMADESTDALAAETYAELRRLASRFVKRERAPSIQATDLVHEAYIRLSKQRPAWADRTHFVAIAAISMRRLLVERARARGADKRGGDQVRVTLDDSLFVHAAPTSDIDLLALDRALVRLADADPQQARIVELRYFGGLSIPETADALGISEATVKRHWTFARAWLLRELQGTDGV